MLSFRSDPIRFLRIAKLLSALVLLSFFFISFLQVPVYNYDFWWHLATGKYIVENNALPQSDPFSYTTHETPTKRKTMILKGNWLAEVILYKTYSLLDLEGIILLRAVLMLLFLFFVFLAIRNQGASVLLALILTAGVFIISKGFLGERPQLFTFLFFSVSFYLLEDFRVSKSRKVFLIPFLVLILSNMHPGYIVCVLLVTLYLVGEGLYFITKKAPSAQGFKILFAVWILSIIFSFFNPTGLSAFTEAFSLGKRAQEIVEHMPTFYIYSMKFKPVDYSYIIFLAFSVLTLRYLRKLGLVHMLLLAVFTAMSFYAIRYLIFYMCVAAPILARTALFIKEEKIVRPLEALKVREVLLYVIAFLASIGLILFDTIPSFAKYGFKANTAFAVPKDAADFLANQDIKGNMFNEVGAAGYLIWRLYPNKKVFTDGRNLEPDVYDEYSIIGSAGYGRNQSWEALLKKHNISYVVMPPLSPRGEIYPIVEKLLERDDWILIHNDLMSLIFLKNTTENEPIIRKFAKDKEKAFDTIIVQASVRAKKNKANPYYLITLGKVFYKTGRLDDAERAFELASQRDPENPAIREWLQKAREGRW